MVWTELCVFGDREREKKGNMTQRAETSELQSGPMQQGQERIQSLWESFTLMVCSGTCSKAARWGMIDSSMQSALPTEREFIWLAGSSIFSKYLFTTMAAPDFPSIRWWRPKEDSGGTHPEKQWAAVSIHWFPMMEPPHRCPWVGEVMCRATCHGHSPWTDTLPPTILDLILVVHTTTEKAQWVVTYGVIVVGPSVTWEISRERSIP